MLTTQLTAEIADEFVRRSIRLAPQNTREILEQLDRGAFEFVFDVCLKFRVQLTPDQLRQIQLQGDTQAFKQVVALLHPGVQEVEYVAPGFRSLRTGIVSVGSFVAIDSNDDRSQLEQNRIAEARWKAYLQISPDIVFIDDRDGVCIASNATRKRIGYDAADIVGKPFELIYPERLTGIAYDNHREAFRFPEVQICKEWVYDPLEGFPLRFQSTSIAYGDEVLTTVHCLNPFPWMEP
jgi:PAS domain-containing protein